VDFAVSCHPGLPNGWLVGSCGSEVHCARFRHRRRQGRVFFSSLH
jgi:hypothetical protein